MNVKQTNAIVDLSNNTLRTSSITTSVFRYKYVRTDVGAAAESAGEFSFYGAVTSAGVGIFLSLFLYPYIL